MTHTTGEDTEDIMIQSTLHTEATLHTLPTWMLSIDLPQLSQPQPSLTHPQQRPRLLLNPQVREKLPPMRLHPDIQPQLEPPESSMTDITTHTTQDTMTTPIQDIDHMSAHTLA